MKVELLNNNMYVSVPPAKQANSNKDETEKSSVKNNADSTTDKVTISAEGLKKSQQAPSESAQDKVPTHIKRLKEQIKEIKENIEAQKEKITEVTGSSMSDEQKQATLELYQEQLVSLQSSLQLTSTALRQAIKDAGITDPSVLMAALA